ncbi:acyl-CoA thioesterase [Bacteroidota bacterium]
MYSHETKTRIRYGETDRMGYAHHANYPLYFEEGRMELLRSLDLNYKDLEDSGIILPVISINTKFLSPVYYDDVLTIMTILKEIPRTRLKFYYEVLNQNKKLVTRADVVLAFVDSETRKPMMAPEIFIKQLKKVKAFQQ